MREVYESVEREAPSRPREGADGGPAEGRNDAPRGVYGRRQSFFSLCDVCVRQRLQYFIFSSL